MKSVEDSDKQRVLDNYRTVPIPAGVVTLGQLAEKLNKLEVDIQRVLRYLANIEYNQYRH